VTSHLLLSQLVLHFYDRDRGRLEWTDLFDSRTLGTRKGLLTRSTFERGRLDILLSVRIRGISSGLLVTGSYPKTGFGEIKDERKVATPSFPQRD